MRFDIDTHIVWGRSIRCNVYIFAAVYAGLGALNLLAIIDYVQLPDDASDEVTKQFWSSYMMDIPIRCLYALFVALILTVIPYRCFYQFVSIFMTIRIFCDVALICAAWISLKLILKYSLMDLKGNYLWGFYVSNFLLFANIFLSVVLIIMLVKISFFHEPEPVVVLHQPALTNPTIIVVEKRSEEKDKTKSQSSKRSDRRKTSSSRRTSSRSSEDEPSLEKTQTIVAF